MTAEQFPANSPDVPSPLRRKIIKYGPSALLGGITAGSFIEFVRTERTKSKIDKTVESAEHWENKTPLADVEQAKMVQEEAYKKNHIESRYTGSAVASVVAGTLLLAERKLRNRKIKQRRNDFYTSQRNTSSLNTQS